MFVGFKLTEFIEIGGMTYAAVRCVEASSATRAQLAACCDWMDR